MIYDRYSDDRVEVWTLNEDAGADWLLPYRQDYSLHLPIMKNADAAFERYRLGRRYRTVPPLYIVIDKRGVIRHRSTGQGSIALEEVARLVDELLAEG